MATRREVFRNHPCGGSNRLATGWIEGLEPRLLLAGSPGPVDVILDNSATSGVQVIGLWYHNTSSPYGYLHDFFADTVQANSSNTPGSTQSPLSITYTPTLPTAGSYQVYVHLIRGSGYNTAVPISINATSGTVKFPVNESQNTTNWLELGTFNFNAGAEGSLTITDAGLAVGQLINADAVRFVKDAAVVDFSQDKGPATHRATGFLASYGGALPTAVPALTADPVNGLVAPLQPHMFRTDTASGSWGSSANTATGAINAYASMSSYTNQIQLNLSDEWGYPSSASLYPGYNDTETAQWVSLIKNIITQVNTTSPAPGVSPAGAAAYQWDVWNEPNYSAYFPQGNINQFYATWQAAYNTLRTYAPGAAIVGPSTGWDATWIENFLTWTAQNNCVPDVLSFHPFGDQNYSGGEMAVQYSSDINMLKTWIASWNQANPTTPINITRFSINEYTNAPDEFNPGAAVWAMSDLENAKVDSAAHASWTDPAGVDPSGANTAEFSNYSLDGLLIPSSSQTARDQQTRATWWAYDYYGAVTGELVQVSSGAGSIRGVAGYDTSKHTYNIVLGRDLGTAPSGMTDTLPLVLTNMTAPGIFFEGENVHVQAQLVPSPATAGAALAAPTLTVDTTATITNGQITLNLPNWGPTDVYGVTVSPAAALPGWAASTSQANWNASTKSLVITGATTITADPGTDEPIITGSGTAAVLTINPTSNLQIHIGGLSLSNGASATLTSLGAARTMSNYRLLIIGTNGAAVAPTFAIDSTSTLDLADNDMIVLYGTGGTPFSSIRGDIAAAYHGRLWDKPGLTSSIARTNSGTYGLGYAEASVLGLNTFDGVTLGGNAVLVKYTVVGDTGLSGTVSLGDYNKVISDFNQPGNWTDGNFDFTGTVNLGDYNSVIANFNVRVRQTTSGA